jgi:hypothetical protein
MDPDLRRPYNASFSPDRHARLRSDLARELGRAPEFRLAETPVFLPADLRERCERAAREILALASHPELIARLRPLVPEALRAPHGEELPAMALVDLAIVRGASGALEPRLIEMQGFPSLFAFTCVQLDVWSKILTEIRGMPAKWTGFFGGLDRDAYLALLRRAIVGDHDPAEVALVDIDPPKQKTWVDFEATRRLLGIETVCLTDLEYDDVTRRLFRRVRARRVPVRRIYNRIVFDELDAKRLSFPFDLRDDVVEWAPHPDWYWIWSKATLPHLEHPAVPRARLLSDVDPMPDASGLARFVLKPLFSFAGLGVKVNPTPADVAAIPPAERDQWMLQEKIVYEPALEAADGGGVKVELRMMFLRDPAEREPRLAFNLARLARGAMLGVDFNKDFTWVGSSVALWPM